VVVVSESFAQALLRPIGCDWTPHGSILRIPAKPNANSEGNPNGIPGKTRTPSERSDAGISILQEVFGFVKEKTYPEQSEGRAPLAEKGVRGKGRQPLSPPQHTEPRSAISAPS
jgi:hypothetical protein